MMAGMSALFQSCQDFLERPPYGVQTSENYYTKPEDLVSTLTDAYNVIGTYDFETTLFPFGNIMTDDSEKGGSDVNDSADMYDLMLFRAVSTNLRCKLLWTNAYQGIYKCNLLISKSAQLENKNPELVKRVVAEAKFMRGMYYYFLATTFGGLPLALSPMIVSELTLERSSSDETWNQIEKDFLEASAVLPEKSEYPAEDLGRATAGAAKTMLAKSYLMRLKYKEAEEALAQVVNSGEYGLVPDYGRIFTKEYENGIESIFDIQHTATKSGWMDTEGTVIPIHCMSRKNGGWGFDCPTQDLMDEFEPGDPRLVYTFTVTNDVFAGSDEKINNVDSPTGYHNRKVHIAPNEQDWHWGSDQPYNIRLLRYADVLLLYAEVLNENGKPAEALKFLNLVRDRARNTNPVDPRRTYQVLQVKVELPAITTTNQEKLRLQIWHERRVELAMEYHRREDLIRQKRFGDVMREFAQRWESIKGANFNDNYHYLCPIPQEEIDKSNGRIVQNKGY